MLPQRARAQMVHPAIYATALAAARSMRRTGGKVYYSDGMAALRPRQPTRKGDVAYKKASALRTTGEHLENSDGLNNAPKASPLSPIAIVHRPISNRGAGLGVLLTQGTRQQSCKCAHMSEDERRLGAYEFQAKAQSKRWRDPNQNNDCGLTADTPSMHSEKTNASRKS
ncbi:hypothetical protein B0H14DRAFT_2917993 [Mycena olivaceomarginata]|jgi:hypothetical protein|nr:hypothetical protein B0H14DRAFT_3037823 [Mycena olivaceomarginata]KAJ7781674.1 hypothetical protein B0H14DRAFT_2960812 [Mycena olivaceomarginata]KAJ7795756.1 hypothetical protein B0H14DRAFT_2917993 [Mycena olivaceomarginata]